jgi:hypothetical protein
MVHIFFSDKNNILIKQNIICSIRTKITTHFLQKTYHWNTNCPNKQVGLAQAYLMYLGYLNLDSEHSGKLVK